MGLRLGLVSLVVLLSVGCASPQQHRRPVPQGHTQASGRHSAYLVTHGLHTGIVVPSEQLQDLLPGLAERFPAGRYLEVGWGDNDFYQAGEKRTDHTLKALFWPTDSVVHVVSVPSSPYRSFPDRVVRRLCLSEEQIRSLSQFLADSFLRDAKGGLLPTPTGRQGVNQFYEATGSYHLFSTCNQWTARGLRSAGFAINPAFKLTNGSLIGFIDSVGAGEEGCRWPG
ncbi:TIGR02117 family protein [Synechococcus sp. CS-602]|uniref:TIGR02117 family protein n=1 Tax=Synechococcaceae TaxID=1890426 RepID=UPI0008FF04CA|nr:MULTISPECIES: TIGR02117 family protein [Synechococcaceae]MCT4363754.1 TIGR02117 family protein [Candidatus Regnicoccus frigidus MAG-AL1]APD47952.1 hypothetical protein BM449_06405 [Synechococcus sp. SynAce01]MCT0200990.1 TIGR02117 family protein [Synechococcus sp. CS-603]MCT0204917.1 TIGR02117 family protein [Synechococcus sp. CS-602]MCT0244745.1 TIGR02117 family protein [Synechococcus sp. CS-601]